MLEEGYTVPLATLIKLGDGCPVAGRRILRAMLDLEMENPKISEPPDECPPSIRLATQADAEKIFDLIRLMILENGKSVAELEEDVLRETIRGFLSDVRTTFAVIDGPSHLEGVLCIGMERWHWADKWYMTERCFFVHPDRRASKHAVDLLNYGRWLVNKMSAELGYTVYFTLGLQGTRKMHRKVAFMRRYMGFCGAQFAYPETTLER